MRDPFQLNRSNRLKPVVVERRWLAAYIVACKLGLAVGLRFLPITLACIHYLHYQQTSNSKPVLLKPTTFLLLAVCTLFLNMLKLNKLPTSGIFSICAKSCNPSH